MLVTGAEFDPEGSVAQLYSQLTGVLAGFSFAGLVFVLTGKLARERKRIPQRISADPDLAHESRRIERSQARRLDEALVLLLASFLGLALTSLAYALISGEVDQRRSTVEHAVAGMGFASAALVLLLAIVRLVAGTASEIESYVRGLVAYGAPAVSMMYIGAGVFQAAEVARQLNPVVVTLVFVGIAAPVISALVATRLPRRSSGIRGYRVIALASVLVAVISSLAVPAISLAWDPDQTPLWPVWTSFAPSLCGTTMFATLCILNGDQSPRRRRRLIWLRTQRKSL